MMAYNIDVHPRHYHFNRAHNRHEALASLPPPRPAISNFYTLPKSRFLNALAPYARSYCSPCVPELIDLADRIGQCLAAFTVNDIIRGLINGRYPLSSSFSHHHNRPSVSFPRKQIRSMCGCTGSLEARSVTNDFLRWPPIVVLTNDMPRDRHRDRNVSRAHLEGRRRKHFIPLCATDNNELRCMYGSNESNEFEQVTQGERHMNSDCCHPPWCTQIWMQLARPSLTCRI